VTIKRDLGILSALVGLMTLAVAGMVWQMMDLNRELGALSNA